MPDPNGTDVVVASPDGLERRERRTFLITGGLFLAALAAVVIATALISGGAGDDATTTSTTEACAPDDAVCRGEQQAAERPGIIPDPGEGREPERAGDPGGAGQIAVLLGIVAALAIIVTLVVRSGARNRHSPDGAHRP